MLCVLLYGAQAYVFGVTGTRAMRLPCICQAQFGDERSRRAGASGHTSLLH